MVEATFLFKPTTVEDPAPLYVDYIIYPNDLARGHNNFKYIKNIAIVRSPKLDPWWKKQTLNAPYLTDLKKYADYKRK